jgi:hypothetical protein
VISLAVEPVAVLTTTCAWATEITTVVRRQIQTMAFFIEVIPVLAVSLSHFYYA